MESARELPVFLYLFLRCIFSCRAVARASQNPPAQLVMVLRWNVEGIGGMWRLVGPLRAPRGSSPRWWGAHQSDRLGTIGGEQSEGSDERRA